MGESKGTMVMKRNNKKAPLLGLFGFTGGLSGTRTPDLGIKSPLLYQLS